MLYDFSLFHQKVDKALQHIRQDIGTLRTGRASAQLLDPVNVEAYGGMMRVHEVASVSVPDPSLLVISPWDKSLLQAIEKAIQISGLNLQPVVESGIIRIAIPALTEERRKEMVKLLGQKIQMGLVLIRNIRAEVRKEIEKMKTQPGISEDAVETDLAELDKQIKDYEKQVEQLEKDKEKELMTV